MIFLLVLYIVNLSNEFILCFVGKKKKKPVNYSSIVTDLFDGTIQSSVQCLTCHRVRKIKKLRGPFIFIFVFLYLLFVINSLNKVNEIKLI